MESKSLNTKSNGNAGLAIVIVIVISLICCICSVGLIAAFTYTFNVSSSLEDETNTPVDSTREEFGVSEKIEFDSFYLTVTQVDRNFIHEDAFYQPLPNHKNISLEIEIEAKNSEVPLIDQFDFKVQDEENKIYNYKFFGGKSPEYVSRRLVAEDKNSGWITFEIPNTSFTNKLIFDNQDVSLKGPVIVNLQN